MYSEENTSVVHQFFGVSGDTARLFLYLTHQGLQLCRYLLCCSVQEPYKERQRTEAVTEPSNQRNPQGNVRTQRPEVRCHYYAAEEQQQEAALARARPGATRATKPCQDKLRVEVVSWSE